MGRVLINDTTLRDGEQSPAWPFRPAKRSPSPRRCTRRGSKPWRSAPAMGEEECARIRQVRRQLGRHADDRCRMQAGEIRQSADTGMDWVDISIPASDKLRQYKLREGLPLLLERLAALIHLAHTLGLKVCIGCEDASRASDATLQDIAHRPGRREPPVCAMPIPSVSSTRSPPRRRSPPCAASGPANSRCTPITIWARLPPTPRRRCAPGPPA